MQKQALFKDLTTSFVAAVLYALGYPQIFSLQLFFMPIVGLTLFFHVIRPFTPHPHQLKRTFLCTLFFLLGATLTAYSWIIFTGQEFGDFPFWIALFPFLAFTLICLPQYWGLPFYLVFLKPKIVQWPRPLQHLLLALVLTLLEEYVPQLFPSPIGSPFLQLAPYLGLAPYGGVPLFSFMSFYLASALHSLFSSKTKDFLALITFTLFMLANVVWPLRETPTTAPYHLRVRTIQPNVGNFLKISLKEGDPNSFNEIMKRYFRLSTEAGEGPLDLIIWPEAAFPYPLTIKEVERKEIPSFFKEIQQITKSEILFGGHLESPNPFYRDWAFEHFYNAAFYINKAMSLTGSYEKQILLPFGETLPFPTAINHWIGKNLYDQIDYFAQGNRWTLFETQSGIRIFPNICYELLLSSFLRSGLKSVGKAPHLMVNLTNDSWFGDSAEPEQHLLLGKWRAIEYGLPLLRVTNTGITTFIDRNGLEIKRLGVGVQGYMDLTIFLEERAPTIFERWGIGITILVAFSLFLILGAIQIIRPARTRS